MISCHLNKLHRIEDNIYTTICVDNVTNEHKQSLKRSVEETTKIM